MANDPKQPAPRIRKSNAGRKWFDGKSEELVVTKLEEAFAIGCTVSEACLYADISRETYYNYVKEHRALVDRFEALKDKPILKARATVVRGLDQANNAQWYLERKRKDEFSGRVEHTGADGRNLNLGLALDDPEIKAIKDKAENALADLYKKRISKK